MVAFSVSPPAWLEINQIRALCQAGCRTCFINHKMWDWCHCILVTNSFESSLAEMIFPIATWLRVTWVRRPVLWVGGGPKNLGGICRKHFWTSLCSVIGDQAIRPYVWINLDAVLFHLDNEIRVQHGDCPVRIWWFPNGVWGLIAPVGLKEYWYSDFSRPF